jgi:hypothetical protein
MVTLTTSPDITLQKGSEFIEQRWPNELRAKLVFFMQREVYHAYGYRRLAGIPSSRED